MKKILISIFFISSLFSCQKEVKKEVIGKSKEDLIIEFCKGDIYGTSTTPTTIKYDSVLTTVFSVPKKFKYYKKELDDIYEMKQINDSTSIKWQASVVYDSENNNGAMIRNNVIYIVKENREFRYDSIFNERFIILSKFDQNKVNENLGIK